jgi:hypothetical protein
MTSLLARAFDVKSILSKTYMNVSIEMKSRETKVGDTNSIVPALSALSKIRKH